MIPSSLDRLSASLNAASSHSMPSSRSDTRATLRQSSTSGEDGSAAVTPGRLRLGSWRPRGPVLRLVREDGLRRAGRPPGYVSMFAGARSDRRKSRELVPLYHFYRTQVSGRVGYIAVRERTHCSALSDRRVSMKYAIAFGVAASPLMPVTSASAHARIGVPPDRPSSGAVTPPRCVPGDADPRLR